MMFDAVGLKVAVRSLIEGYLEYADAIGVSNQLARGRVASEMLLLAATIHAESKGTAQSFVDMADCALRCASDDRAA